MAVTGVTSLLVAGLQWLLVTAPRTRSPVHAWLPPLGCMQYCLMTQDYLGVAACRQPHNLQYSCCMHGMQVVDRIEAVMRLKRFSQLGGLQLERDVRLLVSVLGEATGRPVRDKFARLAQMGTLLGLESVAELLEFWRDQAGSAGWRLGEEQVRSCARLLFLR